MGSCNRAECQQLEWDHEPQRPEGASASTSGNWSQLWDTLSSQCQILERPLFHVCVHISQVDANPDELEGAAPVPRAVHVCASTVCKWLPHNRDSSFEQEGGF